MSVIDVFKKLNPAQWLAKGITAINFVISVINGVEAIKSASGSEKKARVLDELSKDVPDLEDLLGKNLVDDPSLLAAASAFIDAYVAFQNALAASKAITGGTPVAQ